MAIVCIDHLTFQLVSSGCEQATADETITSSASIGSASQICAPADDSRTSTAGVSTTRQPQTSVPANQWRLLRRGSFSAAWGTSDAQQPSCKETGESIWVFRQEEEEVTKLRLSSVEARLCNSLTFESKIKLSLITQPNHRLSTSIYRSMSRKTHTQCPANQWSMSRTTTHTQCPENARLAWSKTSDWLDSIIFRRHA